MEIAFTITGAPRTKKNSTKRIWRRDKNTGRNRPYHVQSDAHQLWAEGAKYKIQLACAKAGWIPRSCPVHVRATFYRERAVGDLINFEQALADVLQGGARVVTDDKWIVSWDGSRLAKDAARPRIEVVVREVAA